MFKYIFTHSCLILTLEWGVMYGKKEGRKERRDGRRKGRRRKKRTCRHFQFYPSALWLAKSKIKEAIILTIIKQEDHGLILAGCKSKFSLTSTTPGFLISI